jgi:hypothetical protein
MATMHGDVTDMLMKLSSLRRVPREPDARVIAHRWAVIQPFVLIEARKSTDPADAFAFYKARHAEYFTKLRRANIAPEAIIRRELDNPIIPPARFELELAAAVERRLARLGRVKGRVKPPHRVRKSKSKSKGTK